MWLRQQLFFVPNQFLPKKKPRKVVATIIKPRLAGLAGLGTPRKDPEQMADPVTPEATESFGNKGYNVKVGLLGLLGLLGHGCHGCHGLLGL